MTTDDNVADEFIALAVRAYDAIANELRWLVVPRVVQRHFQCKQTTAAWSNCVCAPRLPSLRAALMCACAPDEIRAHHTALLTRARLFVLLFDCVEHYLRVGGASFVRRAVVELLDGAAEIDDDRDESLLHLFADLLRASIVVVRAGGANEPALFRPTEVVNAERVVVFVNILRTARGVWVWLRAPMALMMCVCSTPRGVVTSSCSICCGWVKLCWMCPIDLWSRWKDCADWWARRPSGSALTSSTVC
jgi:hypothetical protein